MGKSLFRGDEESFSAQERILGKAGTQEAFRNIDLITKPADTM